MSKNEEDHIADLKETFANLREHYYANPPSATHDKQRMKHPYQMGWLHLSPHPSNFL
jgi:hypothetical protein